MAQSIPASLTFKMFKAKVALNRSTEEPLPSRICMQVYKRQNDVNFFYCNTDKPERTFRLTEIEKETKSREMYIIQYFGFEDHELGAVPSFLSYSYEYATGAWTVMLENVNDNSTFPLLVSIYLGQISH